MGSDPQGLTPAASDVAGVDVVGPLPIEPATAAPMLQAAGLEPIATQR